MKQRKSDKMESSMRCLTPLRLKVSWDLKYTCPLPLHSVLLGNVSTGLRRYGAGDAFRAIFTATVLVKATSQETLMKDFFSENHTFNSCAIVYLEVLSLRYESGWFCARWLNDCWNKQCLINDSLHNTINIYVGWLPMHSVSCDFIVISIYSVLCSPFWSSKII